MITVTSPWGRIGMVVLLATGFAIGGLRPSQASTIGSGGSYSIPVLVIHFLPTHGSNIDIAVTGDWGESLALTRLKTQRQTSEIIHALQEGSRYRAFLNSNAVPCVQYRVVGSLEFLSPLPTLSKGSSSEITIWPGSMDCDSCKSDAGGGSLHLSGTIDCLQ